MSDINTVKKHVCFYRFDVGKTKDTPPQKIAIDFDKICDAINNLSDDKHHLTIGKNEERALSVDVLEQDPYRFRLSYTRLKNLDWMRQRDKTMTEFTVPEGALGTARSTYMQAYKRSETEWVLGILVNHGAPSAKQFARYLWKHFKIGTRKPPFGWGRKPDVKLLVDPDVLRILSDPRGITLAEIEVLAGSAEDLSFSKALEAPQRELMLPETTPVRMIIGKVSEPGSVEWLKQKLRDLVGRGADEEDIRKLRLQLDGDSKPTNLLEQYARHEEEIIELTKGRILPESAWTAIENAYTAFDEKGIFDEGAALGATHEPENDA